MKLSSNKKIILYITIMVLIILIVVISQMVLFSYQTADDKILPGVYVNGLYVGGLKTEKAKELIENEISAYLSGSNIIIINGETELALHASDIANVDIDTLIDKAYAANRDNMPITYLDFIKMKYIPVNVTTETILDWQNIYDYIELNQHLFYAGSIDAQLVDYSYTDGQLSLSVTQSQLGYKIDVRETATAAQIALSENAEMIYAVMETLQPDTSTESLLKPASNKSVYSQIFTFVEGSPYSTVPSDIITLEDFTGPVLIMPGQSLSIKEYINYGNYTPMTYRFKQLHVPSVIYGCVLQVGLTIEEHHAASYITDEMKPYPYGQEAVLSADKDLVIKNDFAYPVILVLSYENDNNANRLTCKIYYVESSEYTYIKSVIERHDEIYNVKIYRVYANDTGGVLSRKLLEELTYPVPSEILIKEQEIIEQID